MTVAHGFDDKLALDAWIASAQTGRMNTQEPLVTTQNHVPALVATWDAVREDLAQRRAARLARKQLERELASYTTQADLNDLYALLDHYDDADAAAVRAVLSNRHLNAA
jgi:hypothetical protein